MKLKEFIASNIYWILTWITIQYFEVQLWNIKFNFWKSVLAILVIAILSKIANLFTDHVGMALIIAFIFYIVIPFVLKKENRMKFASDALNRFWLHNTDNTDLFK